jgi:hypothetical protein
MIIFRHPPKDRTLLIIEHTRVNQNCVRHFGHSRSLWHHNGDCFPGLQHKVPQPTLHQNVKSSTQQSDHHRLHPHLHQYCFSGIGLRSVQYRGFPVHLHGAGLDFDGGIFSGFRGHVQQDLEGPLDFYRRQAQQEDYQGLQVVHGGRGLVGDRFRDHDDLAVCRSLLQRDQAAGTLRKSKKSKKCFEMMLFVVSCSLILPARTSSSFLRTSTALLTT